MRYRFGRRAPLGPFDAWPTGGGGFEYFYGFIGGETNQWYPALYEGTTPVEPEKTPEQGYHLHRGLDQQGDQMGPPAKGAGCPTSRSLCTLHPAPRTPRITCPRNGPTSTRASSTRAGTSCARRLSPGRRELGVIPQDCQLTERHPEIPAWDTISAAMKPVLPADGGVRRLP